MKSKYFLVALTLLALLALAGGVSAAASQTVSEPQDGELMFVENGGQFDPQVRFQAQGGNGTLWVTDDGLWVSMMDMERAGDAETQGMGDAERRGAPMERMEQPVRGVALKVSFVGATPQAVEPFELLETEMSYFLGNDPAKWVSGAPVWAGVRYVDLYPGIDLELSGQAGQLALQLVAREGADLGQVRMRVEGGDSVSVMDGQMVVQSALGPVALPLLGVEGMAVEALPEVEMPEGGVFEMATPFAASVVEAEVTDMSAMEPLAEDATAAVATTLIFSTYLGGSAQDEANSIVADDGNFTYGCGSTFSTNFPTKPGAYDASHNGNNDAFVVRYNFAGNLLANTLLGGDQDDWCRDLVWRDDTIYLLGTTKSSNFPATPGAFDMSSNGDYDAFVSRLIDGLKSLSASTYLGGSDYDNGQSMTLDGNGNPILAGFTSSEDFPTTAGAAQPLFGGGFMDAYVTKLNTRLSARTWASYLGGNEWDDASGIAVQGQYAYVAGYTASSDFPRTAGAFDQTLDGDGDGFVTRLNATGGLAYSTFLGGARFDKLGDIDVDDRYRAHVVGVTTSADYPTTNNALQPGLNGPWDVVLSVLNAGGNALVYSTFYGGGDYEWGNHIAVDAASYSYIIGRTASTDLPLKHPFQVTNRGGYDVFMAKVASTGSGALVSATYFGGSDYEDGWGLNVDSHGYVLLAGTTWSADFPMRSAEDNSANGHGDAFFAKLTLAGPRTTSFQDGVSPGAGYAGTRDTCVSQNSPATNYGAAARLNVDGDDPNGSGKDVCTLIKWDVSSIPAGATLTSAKLTIIITNHSTGQVYELYKVKQNWAEGAATWNNQPTRDTKVLGTAGMNALGLYTINLNATGKSVVQGWVDAPATNYGFWICDSANTDGFDLDSSEAATHANRPKLTVQWVHPAVTTSAPAEAPIEESAPEAEAGWQSIWLPLVNR